MLHGCCGPRGVRGAGWAGHAMPTQILAVPVCGRTQHMQATDCNFDGNNAHAGGALLIDQGVANYVHPYPDADMTGIYPTTAGVEVEIATGVFQANTATGSAGGAVYLRSLTGSVEVGRAMLRMLCVLKTGDNIL